MWRLQDKVAVVRGSTSRLRLEAAHQFLAKRAFVGNFVCRQDRLKRTVASIYRSIASAQGDIPDRLYFEVAFDGGSLDSVISSVSPVGGVKLADIAVTSFIHNFDANARRALFAVQKSLPFLDSGESVVLTGTSAPVRGFACSRAYAAPRTALRCDARNVEAVARSPKEAAAIRDNLAVSTALDLMTRAQKIPTVRPLKEYEGGRCSAMSV